ETMRTLAVLPVEIGDRSRFGRSLAPEWLLKPAARPRRKGSLAADPKLGGYILWLRFRFTNTIPTSCWELVREPSTRKPKRPGSMPGLRSRGCRPALRISSKPTG